ncbi:MAG: hypothetical protein KC620_07425 [Myxococcales bacterium]|nr:hypothetical protein [Myxococcales bacterium]
MTVALLLAGCVELFGEPTQHPESPAPVDAAPDAPSMADGAPPPDAQAPDDAALDDAAPGDAAPGDAAPECVPSPETCDGRDEDCDGRIDEGAMPPLERLPGVCRSLEPECHGFEGWIFPTPDALPDYEAEENACDRLDNDCDGQVDEAQSIGLPCTVGVGGCQRTGAWVCDGADAARCNAMPGQPEPTEACNGIDDDCDGTTDEIPGNVWDERVTDRCQVSRAGCVRSGAVVCTRDGEGEGVACQIPEAPQAEVCDGLDNDCDGVVDNGCNTAQVSVGQYHVCSRSADGAVYCWGLRQRRDPPTGRFATISAGGSMTCGVHYGGPDDADFAPGAVQCWGSTNSIHDDVSYRAVSVAAGSDVACAVRGTPDGEDPGEVDCWDSRDVPDPPAVPPDAPPTFRSVSVGGGYACGITDGDAVTCWGAFNQYGQQNCPLVGAFSAVAAGPHHACAMRANNDVVCWGRPERTNAPDDAFASLAPRAGYLHACGIRPETERAECWGDADAFLFTPPENARFASLSVGYSATCGVRTDGVIDCFGQGASGMLETPTTPRARLIAGIPAPYVCALSATADAGVFDVDCWGQTTEGQLPFPERVRDLGVGQYQLCGLDADGRPFCRGHASLQDFELPPGPFSHIECGRKACCALREAAPGIGAAVECWGVPNEEIDPWGWETCVIPGEFDQFHMAHSQLCARQAADQRLRCFVATDCMPAPLGFVPPPTPVIDFDLAIEDGCAITLPDAPPDDPPHGPLFCWGTGRGNVGIPTGEFTKVDCGREGCCALHLDGSLRCWGGGPSEKYAPPEGRFVEVVAGGGFACALDPEGIVSCWGGIH